MVAIDVTSSAQDGTPVPDIMTWPTAANGTQTAANIAARTIREPRSASIGPPSSHPAGSLPARGPKGFAGYHRGPQRHGTSPGAFTEPCRS